MTSPGFEASVAERPGKPPVVTAADFSPGERAERGAGARDFERLADGTLAEVGTDWRELTGFEGDDT